MTSVEKINETPDCTETPTDVEFLEFYSLYKQATSGDNTASKPCVLDLKGNAKWEAWTKQKGLTTEAARDAYEKHFNEMAEKYA